MPEIDLTQYPETIDAFGGNEQRAKVFLDRYSQKGPSSGQPFEKLPLFMWERVAAAIGEDAPQGDRFYDLLRDFKFVPGGRILAGAGVDAEVTYYNCYVIPVETRERRAQRRGKDDLNADDPFSDSGSDSREAIFDTIGLMVDIMSRGGGVGINWSVLRPKGTYLKRVNGTTSGPVSWMDVASRAVGIVKQGGSRRGAAMFMLDDWHPDVLEFIDAKRDFQLITNANVSVAVSDAFMEAVALDKPWQFRFPDTNHPAYNREWDGDIHTWVMKGYPIVHHGFIPARELWRKLAGAAWASGEPGVVFLDRYNKLSTARYGDESLVPVERIISVNPCGEQGLGPYSVCNLGAMNLAAYIQTGRNEVYFDYSRFSADAAIATEFLDRVIDSNYYFLAENEDIQKQVRRIGLGVMGLADALIALKLRYGSSEAVEFTERVFRTMKQAAVSRSVMLASQKGAAPAWHRNMANAPYLAEYRGTPIGAQIERYGLRNLFLLTQAPTGTTSIVAGVNSGIEPFFAFEYTRKDRTGQHRVEIPVVAQYKEDHGIGRPRAFTGELPDYFVTSADVTVDEHIAMQAAAQKYIDSSVSKTINAPNDQTVEEVEAAFLKAYEAGLKGLAYFRDGSGRDQVLYKNEPAPEAPKLAGQYEDVIDGLTAEIDRKEVVIVSLQEQLNELAPHAVVYKRPDSLYGATAKVKTAAGTAYVTVNSENGRPVEIFVNVGKAGSDIMELGEAIGRVASLGLQNGAKLDQVGMQLVGIGGTGKFNPSLPHAVGLVLLELDLDQAERRGQGYHDCEETLLAQASFKHLSFEPTNDIVASQPISPSGQLCPDCSNFSVVLQEGCKKCQLCGWSAC